MADWIINKETGLIFPSNPYNREAKGCTPYCPTAAEIVAGRALGEQVELAPAYPPTIEDPVLETAPDVTEVTLPEAPAGDPEALDPELVKQIERMARIREVVSGIAPEFYAKPAGGRPAMPKVDAVSALTGFKVSVEDVHDAMKGLRLIP